MENNPGNPPYISHRYRPRGSYGGVYDPCFFPWEECKASSRVHRGGCSRAASSSGRHPAPGIEPQQTAQERAAGGHRQDILLLVVFCSLCTASAFVFLQGRLPNIALCLLAPHCPTAPAAPQPPNTAPQEEPGGTRTRTPARFHHTSCVAQQRCSSSRLSAVLAATVHGVCRSQHTGHGCWGHWQPGTRCRSQPPCRRRRRRQAKRVGALLETSAFPNPPSPLKGGGNSLVIPQGCQGDTCWLLCYPSRRAAESGAPGSSTAPPSRRWHWGAHAEATQRHRV